MSGKLDKRLVGLSPKDITVKFVRDIATPEEILNAVYNPPKVMAVQERITIQPQEYSKGCGVIEDLTQALEVLKDVKAKGFSVRWEDYEEYIVATKMGWVEDLNNPPLSGEKAIQKMWRESLKEYNKSIKELEEYLRLKAKFEEGGND